MERTEYLRYHDNLNASQANFPAIPHTGYCNVPMSPKEQQTHIFNTADIFRMKGFETFINETLRGFKVPLLLRRKLSFGQSYEWWACFFSFSMESVSIETVESALAIVNNVKKELLTQSPAHSFFGSVIISKSPFTQEATALASANGIQTETFKQMFEKMIDS